MPSYEQIDELKANTTSEYTTQNGVNGFKITGKNGNSIFLPAAGFCTGTSLNGKGDTGYFWSRWLWSDMPDRAYCIGFDSSYKILLSTKSSREVGRPVRPVRKK